MLPFIFIPLAEKGLDMRHEKLHNQKHLRNDGRDEPVQVGLGGWESMRF